MNNNITINGKEKDAVLYELINLFSLDDYDKKDNSNQNYLKENTVKSKIMNCLGFNVKFETVAVDNGSLIKFIENNGKYVAVTAVHMTIIDDNGAIVSEVTKMGTSNIDMLSSGNGPVSLESAIKSAETDGWKRCITSYAVKPEGVNSKDNHSKSSSNNNNKELLKIQLSKNAVLLNNGMIKSEFNNVKNLVISSEKAKEIAESLGISVPQFSKSLVAGNCYSVTGNYNDYQGQQQFWVHSIKIDSPAAGNDNEQKMPILPEYSGVVTLTSAMTILADGSAHCNVKTSNGDDKELVFLKQDIEEQARLLRSTVAALAAKLTAGLSSNLTAKCNGKQLVFKAFN